MDHITESALRAELAQVWHMLAQERGWSDAFHTQREKDERLLRQALVALTYHEVMTRPIESTTKTVVALRKRLGIKD